MSEAVNYHDSEGRLQLPGRLGDRIDPDNRVDALLHNDGIMDLDQDRIRRICRRIFEKHKEEKGQE